MDLLRDAEAFKNEICAGFIAKDVARILIDAEILDAGASGKSSQSLKLVGSGLPKTRYYVFTSKLWSDDK